MEALQLRTGEQVLDCGCGGGLYAREAALFVGSSGQVRAIDISPEQIAVAQARCAEFDWAEAEVADVTALPYEDEVFDAIFDVQTLDYIPDLDAALGEIYRVLRPGGRYLNLATVWSSVIWRSDSPTRMERVLAAWRSHNAHTDLPVDLPPHLATAGLKLIRQTPLPLLNTSYNENQFSYWIARFIRTFAVQSGKLTEGEADDWMNEFDDLEHSGRYFFCSMPIITEVITID